MTRHLFVLPLTVLLVACGVDHSNSGTGTDSAVPASGGYGFGSTGGSDSSDTDTDTEDTDSDVADTDVEDTGCDESTWFADNDGDGFGSAAYSTWSCAQPTGYVSNDDDLDDSLAVVGSTPTPALICATVNISYTFAFWWDDVDTSDESNTWLGTTVVDTTAACEEVADFRPTHLFALNGYYKGGGNEDEWLVGAGNTSHITNVYVMFEDGSFDEYTGDSTGTYTTIGYAYFVDNGAGGGNLYFEAEPDFEGEHSH